MNFFYIDLGMEIIPISEETSIDNTLKWITDLSINGTLHPEVIKIYNECINTLDPLQKLFEIAYDKIIYEPDLPEVQNLRTINNILKYNKGNCVHYTTLISSVLILMGKEHFRKVVSYSDPNIFEHIYIEVEGKILDPVLGQAQDGTDYINRPLKGQFNKEKSYKYEKLYYMPKLNLLNGTLNGNLVTDPKNFGGRTRLKRLSSNYNSNLGCTNNISCKKCK